MPFCTIPSLLPLSPQNMLDPVQWTMSALKFSFLRSRALHGHCDMLFVLGINRRGTGTNSTTNHIFNMALGRLHGPWCRHPSWTHSNPTKPIEPHWFLGREGIIVLYECHTSHSSNICNMWVCFLSWFDTKVSVEDSDQMHSRLFGTNQQQTYSGSVIFISMEERYPCIQSFRLSKSVLRWYSGVFFVNHTCRTLGEPLTLRFGRTNPHTHSSLDA